MRKDAKIGFAIGGVLLAVIVVYLLVVPRHRATPMRTGVALVTPSGSAPVAEPSPVVNDTNPTPSVTSTPSYVEKSTMSSAAGPAAPVSPMTSSLPSDVSKPAAVASNDSGKDANGNWDKLFPGSTLMSTTGGTDVAGQRPATAGPVVSPIAENTAKPAGVSDAPLEGGATTPRVTPMTSDRVALSNGEAAATPKQYVIKSGQTLSSIAADVYGNSRYYVSILKANPQLNPNRMRPGTRIALPDISDVKPAGALASNGGESNVGSNEPRSLDASGAAGGGVILASEALPQTDSVVAPGSGRLYAVQKGDTLYRIAKRLYGNASKEKAIYNMNQDVIGSNPAKLKLGMVLHLPEGASSGS